MVDIVKLLAQAATPVPQAKAPQTGVPLPSFENSYATAAGMETGFGAESMGEIEADLRNLSPNRLVAKYGMETAQSLMGGQQRANAAYQGDLSLKSGRGPSDVAWDSATGLGTGFAMGLGSLGALGLGLADRDLGAWASEKIGQGSAWVEGQQSSGVNAARRVQRTSSGLDARDNTQQMEQELAAGDSDFIAGLRRWGRDTVDTLGNSITDPTMLGQGTSEAVGSLLAGGPISKGLKAIGATALSAASKVNLANRVGAAELAAARAAGASADEIAAANALMHGQRQTLLSASSTERLARAGNFAAWPTATAGLESGGAYTGAVSEIMGMQHEELMQTSPTYRELVEGGVLPEEAKTRVASKAGLMAAAIQAPIAFGAGTLTRFAETPFKVPSLGSGVRNVALNEPLEEAVQSTTGGLAQNLAVRQYGDENLQLTEGLGEQTAQGALYGFTAAGAVQGPGMALQGSKAAVGAAVGTGKAVATANRERARQILQRDVDASEIGTPAVQAAAKEVIDSLSTVAPAVVEATDQLDVAPEQKQEIKDYLNKVAAAVTYDRATFREQTPFGDEVLDLMGDSTDRVQVITEVADKLAKTDKIEEAIVWGGVLHNLMEPLREAASSDMAALDSLPKEHASALRMYQGVSASIEASDVVQRGMAAFKEYMAANAQEPITEQEIATPAGAARAEAVVAAAELDPTLVSEAAVKTVLDHADAGRIQLTPEKRRSLNISMALSVAAREQTQRAQEGGLKSNDVINENVLTGDDPAYGKRHSLFQHLRDVRQALRAGNTGLARGEMDELSEFVRHMGRKVEALNEHFKSFGKKGRPAYIRYQAYDPETGDLYWSDANKRSKHKGMFVEPTNANGIRNAQAVALEHETLVKAFNGLADAMPELKLKKLDPVALNSELAGAAEAIAQKYQEIKKGTAPATQKAEKPVQEAKAKPEPKTEKPQQGELELQPAKETVEPTPVVEEVTETTTPEPEAVEAPVTNKDWMKGDRQDLRPDNGRARMTVGDTTISYDRDDTGIQLNLIQTQKKEARGNGSARRAMNAFLQVTDDAGLPVSLSVAEQDATTNRDALVKFYSSFGFQPGDGDAMSRVVGAEAVVQQKQEQPTPVVETEEFVANDKNDATQVAKAYPKLISHVRNWFTQLFTMPKQPMTRIWDHESPSDALRDAVSEGLEGIKDFGVNLRYPHMANEDTLNSFAALFRTDPKAKANAAKLVRKGERLTPSEANSLANVKGIVQVMQQNLRVALNKPYSKTDKRTFAELLKSGRDVQRLNRLKGLNIAQETEDGNYVYNPTLVEAAVLAGLNWALTMGRSVQERDPEQIARITGLPEEAQGNAAESLMQGFTSTEIANALVPMIKRYWNVRDPRNDEQAYADPAYLDGIPTAVAMEVMRAMEQIGLLVRHTAIIPDPVAGVDRPFYVFETHIPDPALLDYSDLIEEMVAVKPEVSIYLGDERAPVPGVKLNTQGVENTKQDKAAIKTANDTPYFFNSENYGMFQHFEEEDFKTTFGGGIDDDKTMNVMHLMSVRGRNSNILSGWNAIQSLGRRLQQQAGDGNLDDVTIHYAHNMSSVNRMQQLGGMTPQGNKLVRELVLPTKAKVDMSKPRTRQLFDLAVAQGLEIKIHKMTPEDASKQLATLLDGTLAPAVEAMTTWLKDKSTPLNHAAVVKALRAANKEVTPLAFHVLKEHARFQLADDAARSSFETTVYIEADGVTNGVIMAQFLMSIGGFNEDQIRNLMMGGVTVGPSSTLAELHPRNKGDDLYTVSARKGQLVLNAQVAQINSQKDRNYVAPHQHAVLDLLAEFLPGVKITYGDKGSVNVSLDRSVSKNPMTVTLYGSSPNGIANKITSLLMDEVYARASTGEISGDARARFNMLMAGQLKHSRKNNSFYVNNELSASPINFSDMLKLKLEAPQFKQLQANILVGMVNPLRMGIEQTLGSDMMDSTTHIRKAMQLQSIFYEQLYRKRIQEALDYRKQNDPSYKQGDFLSKTDLEKIRVEMENVAPWFRTANQTLLINKFSFLQNGYNYGRSLDDGEEGFRPFAQVHSPVNSGVSAIAYLNIALGDGQTIQRAWSSGQQVFQRALPVFDGVNLSLNDIDEASEILNRTVFDAGMTNPHLAVMTSFNKFLNNTDITGLLNETYAALNGEDKKAAAATRKLLSDLDFAIGNPSESFTEMDAETYLELMENITNDLKEATVSVEARHRVMKKISMSIDQFAAVGKPHQTQGELLSADLSPGEVAARLNELYIAESAELSKLLETPKEVLPGAIVDADTGARIYTNEAIVELAKGAVLSPLQSETLAAVLPGLQDFTVIAGTPEQINITLGEQGKPAMSFIRADGAVRNGVIDVDAKTIYLVNQNPEVLVHELVHAATFDTLLRHYNGEKLSSEATAAIGRLEALMEQFKGMRASSAMTADQIQAMGNAKIEIDNALNNPQRTEATNKAAALNEFMAWATTNNALSERLSKIKAKPLAQLIGAVIDAIKSLLRLPKADMLSNVVFNTGIIAMEKASLTNLLTEVTLDHASNDAPSPLIHLRDRLARKIYSYIDSLPEGKELGEITGAWQPIQLGKMVTKDFQNVFGLTQVQSSTLELVVAALATNMELDTTALGQAQVLYQHVLENLSVESFMDPKAADAEAERFYAVQKFNLVTGKTGRVMDKAERSSLMATFLGMGMVSPEFMSTMAKLPQMKTKDSRDGTFDKRVSFEAERALNKLGEIVSGQRSKSVDQALASLAQRVFAEVSEERGLVKDSLNRAYQLVDKGNDYIVGALTKLSDWGVEKGARMEKATDSKVARAAAVAFGVAAGALSKENAALQAETTVSWANKLKVPPTISRLITDLIGRTDSNANLYDRIKLLRSSIQQLRQHFRTDVPRELAQAFTKNVTEGEWTAMFKGLAKTDFASLMSLGNVADVARLVSNKARRDKQIASLEQALQSADPDHFALYQQKAKQLADYMNGKAVGANLLTNAEAISMLLNMPKRVRWQRPGKSFVTQLDQLISLYAIDGQSKETLDTLGRLFKDEASGMSVVTAYMASNRADEMDRIQNSRAKYNYIKGYIPSHGDQGKSLRVVDNKEGLAMRQMGYTNIGTYTGSQLDAYSSNKSYFFSELPGKAAVAQGIMQNIHRTAGGVDPVTGYRVGPTAGRIASRAAVLSISKRINKDRGNTESLVPVFDDKGRVIAYERAIDPKMLAKLNPSTQLHEMLGVWRGRQVEEMMAREANIETMKTIDKMYRDTIKGDHSRKKEFVNLMDSKSLDPVIQDMVELFSFDTVEYIKNSLDGELWVRREMLEDVTGYRQPSVSDFWTGISRWSPTTRNAVRDMAVSLFGIKAYQRLSVLEQVVQGLASDARTMIVVKSGLIPVLNFMSNVYHLLASGVPITDIVKQVPRKLVELRAYNRGVTRKIQLEVQLRAARDNPTKLARLRAEMRSINDSFKRLSIAPLIEAGEFSTVADVGDRREDLQLSSGKIGQWLDGKISKLPKHLQTPAKIALVSKDTALFQGLQKSVQYGDFLAKAVLYDHHTKRKGMKPKESLGIITDEFVNYDRLPGRVRGGLENFGLLWFYNFKLRMVKVAASTLRNRPLYTLLVSQLPTMPGAEMPIGDSIISKLAEGTLGYSVGPEMGFTAPTLNPWWNLVN